MACQKSPLKACEPDVGRDVNWRCGLSSITRSPRVEKNCKGSYSSNYVGADRGAAVFFTFDAFTRYST